MNCLNHTQVPCKGLTQREEIMMARDRLMNLMYFILLSHEKNKDCVYSCNPWYNPDKYFGGFNATGDFGEEIFNSPRNCSGNETQLSHNFALHKNAQNC